MHNAKKQEILSDIQAGKRANKILRRSIILIFANNTVASQKKKKVIAKFQSQIKHNNLLIKKQREEYKLYSSLGKRKKK